MTRCFFATVSGQLKGLLRLENYSRSDFVVIFCRLPIHIIETNRASEKVNKCWSDTKKRSKRDAPVIASNRMLSLITTRLLGLTKNFSNIIIT